MRVVQKIYQTQNNVILSKADKKTLDHETLITNYQNTTNQIKAEKHNNYIARQQRKLNREDRNFLSKIDIIKSSPIVRDTSIPNIQFNNMDKYMAHIKSTTKN